jgi:hypothetical protein
VSKAACSRKIGRRLIILHCDLMAWLTPLPAAEIGKAS